jgi:prevent-host-death family protein
MDDEYVTIEQARPKLGEYIDRARLAGEHIFVTRNGKVAAVIVPADWHEAAKRQIREARGDGLPL